MVQKKTKESKASIASGKRKSAIAKASIVPGQGLVRVNSQMISNLEPELARLRVQEPLRLAGDLAKKVNINVSVSGGGWMSQIDAARLSIARALVVFSKSEDLKKTFLDYDRQLLVADTRRKEQRKPGTHSNARAKRQLSFR